MDKTRKIRAFHGLLAKTKMMYAKRAMLDGQGVDSTSELTEQQLDGLINYLLDLVVDKNNDASKEVRQWRSKVLRVMARCGVDTNNWSEVNAFMLDKRIAGRHLYEFKEVEELKALHRKLNNVAGNMELA